MEPNNQNPQTSSSNITTSGFAIASLILGFFSFIPVLGFLTGIVATTLGIIALIKIKKDLSKGKGFAIAGVILGILGVLFTPLLYGAMFYFFFVAKNGPLDESKKLLSQQLLTQNAGSLELYKKKYGACPNSLDELTKDGFAIFSSDHYLKPFYYKVSPDGISYELRSLGPDGAYNTADDIFPNIQPTNQEVIQVSP